VFLHIFAVIYSIIKLNFKDFFAMKKIFLLSCVVVLFASCASLSTPVGIATLYSQVTSGVTATSNELGSKVGHSSANNILGLIATGDASIQVAARSAGITKISHVDQKHSCVLGLFATYETIVYGN
jgi:hypothetical protein